MSAYYCLKIWTFLARLKWNISQNRFTMPLQRRENRRRQQPFWGNSFVDSKGQTHLLWDPMRCQVARKCAPALYPSPLLTVLHNTHRTSSKYFTFIWNNGYWELCKKNASPMYEYTKYAELFWKKMNPSPAQALFFIRIYFFLWPKFWPCSRCIFYED